jgi:excisionase family DNA binding protein
VTDRLLTAGEVAELLAVPESWVCESTRSGAMPSVELGRYRRYDRDDVLAWVESCKCGGRLVALRRHEPKVRT